MPTPSASSKTRLGPGGVPRPRAGGFGGKGAEVLAAGVVSQYVWSLFKKTAALIPMTNGAISGAGTVLLQGHHAPGGLFGGILLTTDGSSTATVEIRKNNASGEQIMSFDSEAPGLHLGPFKVNTTQVLYYSITGVGAKGQLYEHVP